MTYLRPSRSQLIRRQTAGVLFLLGVPLAGWAGSGLLAVFTGGGWSPVLLHWQVDAWLRGVGLNPPPNPPSFPVALQRVPGSGVAWAVCTAALFAGWLVLVVARVARGGVEERTRGLGHWPQLRRRLSARAARRAGRFTRPDLTVWRRWTAPREEFGYRMGRLRGTRHELWANFEVRVRVIARTGWGKTSRLLVRVVRDLPGAALVGTTSPDLFEQTVRAREAGRALPRGWRVWTRGWWAPGVGPARPVLVVDFSDPTHRYAAGFTRVRWNLVAGCRDLTVATRRAHALVAGAEDGDRNDDRDGFFRSSASQVIAAWLHAADLAGLGMDDVVRWQKNIHLSEPHDVLERHPGAEPAARLALLKHLDDRAERTTSSVERFIVLALHPFATRDGREFAVCGSAGVDLAELIRTEATVYLLASPTTAAAVAPLITLFADEWFHTCRSVALSLPARRLPRPAVGVLDELRTLVPIPSLPQVAYEMRKYGVGVLYALQNAAQERELYGDAAESLAQNVQLTVVGGYDTSLAEELTAQAGEVAVAAPSVNGFLAPTFSEGTTWRPVITAGDQQRLDEGDAVLRMAGLPLFYGRLVSFRDSWPLHRQIRREERDVKLAVAAAQAVSASLAATEAEMAQAVYERPVG